ncbi:APC family permease [Cryobacterium sp. BB736]|uniref:APC family permease n=1 Tax=Cryobacterium sp. BB736 TaxID=2746963 RepID=UPI0018746EA9|nr:amino acid permease [Cryobacterium sp. BB736]
MTRTMDAAPTHTATGTVGLWQGSALYIASVLGTGILVLPALAASVAGPASIIAITAVLVLSIPLAGTFAALAARYPDAGGVATFVRRALGNTAARAAGYWFFFGVGVGMPVVAVLGAAYIVGVVGGPRWAVVLVAVVLLVPPFLSNLFGVRVSGRVQLVLSGLLVVIVVGVILVTVPAADADNFQPFLPHGWAGVGAAINLFVWATAGWEAVTHIAGEFRNPRRTIPFATAIAILAVGAAYLGLQVVTIAVMGVDASKSDVPLLDLVATTAPGIGPIFVAFIAGVVAVGVLNLYVGAFAKLGASLGRDGDLPRWMAAGAETGGVPRRALLVVAGVGVVYMVALVLADLNLTSFILIHTSCMVAIYGVGMAAAVRLLDRYSVGWWLAVISCVLVLGLLALAGFNLVWPVGLATAAVIVTVVKRRSRALTPPDIAAG